MAYIRVDLNTPSYLTLTLKALLRGKSISQRLEEILGKRSAQFSSSILTAVANNQNLSKCEPMTIIQAAMQAAVLDLPIQQNFGFAYLIPFNNTKAGKTECQFQMGYKGYIQLAIRTGLYEKINVFEIREGELEEWNPIEETLKINLIKDPEERLKKPITGYAGYIKMHNGFTKTDYWTTNELLEHADKYSQQYRKYKSGMWIDQFDAMAKKTVIKNLLSKWGALSVEMQKPSDQLLNAIEADQAVIREENKYEYIDNVEFEEIETREEETGVTKLSNKETKEEGKEEAEEEIQAKEKITLKEQGELLKSGDPKIVESALNVYGYRSINEVLKKDYKSITKLIKETAEKEKLKNEENPDGGGKDFNDTG